MDRGRGRYRRGGGIHGGGRHYTPRGRSQRSAGTWIARGGVLGARGSIVKVTLTFSSSQYQAGVGAHPDETSSGSGSSEVESRNSEAAFVDGEHLLSSENPNGHNSVPLDSFNVSPNDGNSKVPQNIPGTEHDKADAQENGASFDICKERDGKVPMLKTPLHIKNKALRNEKRRIEVDNIQILRPGMILLKGYLSLTDQVKLVKSCRNLGRGPGGFYQPGYRDGAKLSLKMMCLGKNWDPETSKYDDIRPTDQAKAPPVPDEFQRLVKEAIQKCYNYLESDCKVMDPSKHLPLMSPNICIINFYSSSGKLGLHQDKDESQESLQKGLPVVSFSLGDTAEFLFGVKGDVDEARKVELKSGDVLIFGGESRHIFHGVSKIVKDTAPKDLLEETHLKPGRLNLTFRQY